MSEDIIIKDLVIKTDKESINLKKVSDIEYHSDQHKSATEFHMGKRSVRIYMTHSDFKLVQEEFDKINL